MVSNGQTKTAKNRQMNSATTPQNVVGKKNWAPQLYTPIILFFCSLDKKSLCELFLILWYWLKTEKICNWS